MPTIYKPMEPQPEIEIAEQEWVSPAKTRYVIFGLIKITRLCEYPYKPGDEIEFHENQFDDTDRSYFFPPAKGTVKSCEPVLKDGVWCWKEEVE